jgi:hypothetical protein
MESIEKGALADMVGRRRRRYDDNGVKRRRIPAIYRSGIGRKLENRKQSCR